MPMPMLMLIALITPPRYFAAGKDRGVFVTASKLLKLDADDNYDSCDDSVCESQVILHDLIFIN